MGKTLTITIRETEMRTTVGYYLTSTTIPTTKTTLNITNAGNNVKELKAYVLLANMQTGPVITENRLRTEK